jgi:hypothetical protein
MTTTHAIPYDRATEMLRQPGFVLMKMFAPDTRRGKAFYIVGRKRGGPVTDTVAAQILAHPKCHAVDPGLFPGIDQSFSLYHGK